MPRFGLIAFVALAPLASPAFAQSYGQSQYQQAPAPYPGQYPGAVQPYQPYPGQAPNYGQQAPYGYNGAPPPNGAGPPGGYDPQQPRGYDPQQLRGYDPQQPRGYNQAPRASGGERYGGTPGFTCNASFPFRGLQQTLVCPLGQPRPIGAPCSCPPPAGFPVGGRMPGQVVQ